MFAFAATDFGGPEKQALLNLPVPEAGFSQMLVRVHAAGVNPADWKKREGWLGTKVAFPMVMGLELAGTVEAVGDGVGSFAIGDRVVGGPARGHGAFAEYTVLDAEHAQRIPTGVSFADAAVMPVAGATAYDGIHTVPFEAGETLVIIGAGGGVGNIAAQLGRVHHLNTIGVASESKRLFVESTGATFVPSGDGVVDGVKAAAAGPIHHVLDLVGGNALKELASLAKDPAAVVTTADPTTAKELGGTPVNRTAESLEKMVGMLEYKLIDPNIKARYSLEEAAVAIAHVEDSHATGKAVIEMISD